MSEFSVEAANARLISQVGNARAAVASIRDSLTIPTENKKVLIDQARWDALESVKGIIAEIRTAVEERKEELKSELKARYLPAGDPVAGIAADNQAWARVRALLDSGMDPDAIIQDALDRGDMRTVKVLNEDLRMYLAAKNGSFEAADAYQEKLAAAMYQTAGPEYRAIADELAKLEDYTATGGPLQWNSKASLDDVDPYSSNVGAAADMMLTPEKGVVRIGAA